MPVPPSRGHSVGTHAALSVNVPRTGRRTGNGPAIAALGATTVVDRLGDAEPAVSAGRRERVTTRCRVLERLADEPPLQELTHHLPRLRHVPREEPSQVRSPRRHTAHQRVNIQWRDRLKVRQFGVKGEIFTRVSKQGAGECRTMSEQAVSPPLASEMVGAEPVDLRGGM